MEYISLSWYDYSRACGSYQEIRCTKIKVGITTNKVVLPRLMLELPRIKLGLSIKVITKLPNSEQSYKGKVKTHNYVNRQNQSTTGKLWKQNKVGITKNQDGICKNKVELSRVKLYYHD
jgi:hypothetical protein